MFVVLAADLSSIPRTPVKTENRTVCSLTFIRTLWQM